MLIFKLSSINIGPDLENHSRKCSNRMSSVHRMSNSTYDQTLYSYVSSMRTFNSLRSFRTRMNTIYYSSDSKIFIKIYSSFITIKFGTYKFFKNVIFLGHFCKAIFLFYN